MGRFNDSSSYQSDDTSSDNEGQTPQTRRTTKRSSLRLRDRSPRIPRLQSSPSYPLSRQLSTSVNTYSQWPNGRSSSRPNQFHLILSNSHFRDASVELKNLAPLLLRKYPPLHRFSHILDRVFQIFENQLEAEQLQLIEEHCREGRKNPFLRNRKRLRSPETNTIYRNQNLNQMNVRRRLRSSQDVDDEDFELSSLRPSRGRQIRSNLNKETVSNDNATAKLNNTQIKEKKDDESSDSDSSCDFKPQIPVLRPRLPERERCLISDFTSLTPYISDSDDDTETEELRKAAARRPTRWKSDIFDDTETIQFEKRHYVVNGKPYFCLPFPYRRMRRDAIVIFPPAERTSDGHIPPLQWPNEAKQHTILKPIVVNVSPVFNGHFMSAPRLPPIPVPSSLISSVPVTNRLNQQSVAKDNSSKFRGPPKHQTPQGVDPAKLQEIDQMLGLTNRSSQGLPSNTMKSNSFSGQPSVARSSQPQRQPQHQARQNPQQSQNMLLNVRNPQLASHRLHNLNSSINSIYGNNNQTRLNQIPSRTLGPSIRGIATQPQDHRTSSGDQIASNGVIKANGLLQNTPQNRPTNVPNGNIQLQGSASVQMQKGNFLSGANRVGYSSSHQRQYRPPGQNSGQNVFPSRTTGGSQMMTVQRVQNQLEVAQPHANIQQKIILPQHMNLSMKTSIPPQTPSKNIMGINHSKSLSSRISNFQPLTTLSRTNHVNQGRKSSGFRTQESSDMEVINLVDDSRNNERNHHNAVSTLQPYKEGLNRNQLNLISNISPNNSMDNIRVNVRQNLLESGAVASRSENVDTRLMNGVIIPNGNGLPIQNSLVNNTNTGVIISRDRNGGSRRISDEELLMEFSKQYQADLAFEMEKAKRQPHR